MDWKRLLAYISGSVDEELLLRNEYLITENRILRAQRHGIPPAPEREKTTTRKELIRSHMDVLAATDFFTTEVWTKGGLVTYYVLFFMHVATRRVYIAGLTPYPNEEWMTQIARNVTMVDVGFLEKSRYLIHDRDGKFCPKFQEIIKAAGVKLVKLPARSPKFERSLRTVGEVS